MSGKILGLIGRHIAPARAIALTRAVYTGHSLHYTAHSVHSLLCSVHSALSTVHTIHNSPQCAQCSIHSTLPTIQCLHCSRYTSTVHGNAGQCALQTGNF